jgi:hypothetical protein
MGRACFFCPPSSVLCRLIPARPGGDRLSRALRRSTIGAEGFHGRVRDGIGCWPLAKATRPCGDQRTEDGRQRTEGDCMRPRAFSSSVFTRSYRACHCKRAGRATIAEAIARAIKRLIERLVPVSAGIAPFAPPAYRRGGLPRLSARPGFEGGFPLRCFQRLSRPHIATRRCGWRHNRYTRGASIPVLSY